MLIIQKHHIDAKDLLVGNYIERYIDGKEWSPIIVTAEDIKNVVDDWIGFNKNHRPIPITPQSLKMIGLSYSRNHWACSQAGGAVELDGDGCNLVFFGVYFPLTSIHQFQNLHWSLSNEWVMPEKDIDKQNAVNGQVIDKDELNN